MHTFAGGFRTDSDDYKNMEKKRHIKVAGVLFFVWTAVILYGSLSPGDDLPPMGWLARIPHFDKIVHFCFYLGQVLLLLLWLQPSRGNRIWVALCAIIFSGTNCCKGSTSTGAPTGWTSRPIRPERWRGFRSPGWPND